MIKLIYRRFFLFVFLAASLVHCGKTDETTFQPSSFGKSADEEASDNQDKSNLGRYPILLAHGLFGSDSVFSMQEVAKHLREHGFKVFVTEVSALNSIEYRSHQLSQQINAICEKAGSDKVHIIAHSMGGLDARYSISALGGFAKVSSLTTISTPHRGTPVADEVMGFYDEFGELPKSILELATSLYNNHTDIDEVSLREALSNLTTDFAEAFNEEVPNHPDVLYQSYAANATPRKNLPAMLSPTYKTVFEIEGKNDGLVSVTSAEWGNFLGTLSVSHTEEISRSLEFGEENFNSREFFLRLAKGLE